MKHLFLIAIFSFSCFSAFSQSVFGYWKTIDDNSGDTKSIVHIYQGEHGVMGKVVELFQKQGEDPDPVCEECSKDDPRYGKKVKGMVIMSRMQKDDDEYAGGEILDPENGSSYRCKIWTDGEDQLKVRGYLGPFFRTQTWIREWDYK